MNPSIRAYLSKLLALTPRPVYLVGGSVRDLLIGIPDIRDIDILISSASEEIARNFADIIGGSFFFLDEDRKITRVIKHENGETLQFDFTNFEGDNLHADLGRRDFTINAMALNLRTFIETKSVIGLVDLYNGKEDIRKKMIRMTTPGVFDEDPLRLLRAVRLAAVLGFTIEKETAEQIRSRAALVTHPAPERIRDEFFQILAQRGAGRHLAVLDSLGLLARLLPELDALQGFAPGRHHVHDVRTHSIRTAEYVDGVLDDLPKLSPRYSGAVMEHLDERLEHLVPRKAALRFACLLHDIAKPETFSQDQEGHVHFYGHDSVGAEKAKETCRRFRLSRSTEALVAAVIKQHMRLFNLSTPAGPSKNALYRYCRDLADAVPESLILAQSDARATYELMPREKFTDTEKHMTTVLEYYYGKFMKTEAKPLVNGNDLIERGFAPGPRFRQILDEIKERQAAGTINDRAQALEYLDGLK